MSPQTTSSQCQTPAAAAAAAVLEQAASFVQTLPEGAYERPCAEMMGACIGQHLRHSLDHVRAILDGLGDGVIDYDHRERGVDIETNAGAAVQAVRDAVGEIVALDPEACAQGVSVRVMLSSSGETADLPTSVSRELAFAAHHQTHHHAMMATIARAHGVEIPEGFGVAPSTLNFQENAG